MNKTLRAGKLFLPVALLFVFGAHAQEPCGTIATTDVLQWWNARAQALQAASNKTTQAYTVPVHIHIVGDNNGAGYFATANAYQLVCELNTRFAPLQISFFLDDSITHINNSNYTNPTLPYTNQMMNANNRPRACNIYLVPALAGLCGYAYFPNSGPAQGRGGIVLKNGCSLPGNSDPTHEMGHYFSLLHTFQGWNTPNAERVNGSNCVTAGDYFCDTRADWQDFRWNCPYTGSYQDGNGDYYHPDSSLYMGYSNAPCPTRFSAEQQTAVIYSRANDRPYLDSVSAPSYPPLTATILLQPADGETAVPSSANAVFRWARVAGATAYNLRIVPATATTFSAPIVNVVVPDTFSIVNGLAPGSSYKWEVLPVNNSATCISPDAAGVQRWTFGVVFANSVGDVGDEITDLTLAPNPLRADEEVRILLAVQQPAEVLLEVFAMDGTTVFAQKIFVGIGENVMKVPAKNFSTGVYSLRVSSTRFTVARRFIVQP